MYGQRTKPTGQMLGTHTSDDDKERLVDQISLSKETESEVDEDEILADLGKTRKDVFACPL